MKKLIKIIILTLLAIFALGFVAVIALISFINPNDFKNKITEEFYAHTGRELAINGNIAWTFFPTFGLEVEDIALSNNPKFSLGTFAKIGETDISLKVIPLLSKKIFVNKIILKDLNLALAKNSKGETNWQDLTTAFASKESSQQTLSPSKKESSFKLDIASVLVSNATLSFIDSGANRNISVTHFNLKSTNINFIQPFDFQVDFNLNSESPKISGEVDLEGTIRPDLANNSFHISPLKFTGKLQDGNIGTIPFSMKSTINYDLKTQSLNIEDLNGSVMKSDVNGNLSFTNLATPNSKLNGLLKINPLTLGNFRVNNINIPINGTPDLINFSPINAKLYKGTLRGNLSLDLKKTNPKITTNLFMNNIALESLLADMADLKKISGNFQLKLNLITEGDNSTSLLRNLNGNGMFNLTDGVWHGIDIMYVIDFANSLINKITNPLPPSIQQTKFSNFRGSFKIASGILSSNDLLIQSNLFQVTGFGSANLVDQTLNFNLNARGTEGLKIANFSVPIKISGNIENLNIRPDYTSITLNVVKSVANKVILNGLGVPININQKVTDKIMNVLPINKLFSPPVGK